MIPWANFGNASYDDVPYYGGIQISEFLLEYVDQGPSMTTIYFESPMLEIAHDRQFVVAQQGGDSSAFEIEHTRRIEECLKQLGDHFRNFANEDYCRPTSPCTFELLHCCIPDTQLDTMPPLTLPETQLESMIADGNGHAPTPMTTSTTWAKPLDVMNPTMIPGYDTEDEDLPMDAAQTLLSVARGLRAGTTLPIHAARSQRPVRQRKRVESKLATKPQYANNRKRSSQWMVDEAEEEDNIAKRRQSAASLISRNPHQ